jgi:hypothetical protein
MSVSRHALEGYYREYDPSKTSADIDKILLKYEGKHAKLVKGLFKKYGVTVKLESEALPPAAPTEADLLAEIASVCLSLDSDAGESSESASTANAEATVEDESAPTPATVVLDLGYDLPKEKRPRTAAIRALVKQVENFHTTLVYETAVSEKGDTGPFAMPKFDFNLHLCGKLVPLLSPSWAKGEMLQHSDVTLREQSVFDESEYASRAIIYLSPDAEELLDVSGGLPDAIICVGGLIDRRAKNMRSLKRAIAGSDGPSVSAEQEEGKEGKEKQEEQDEQEGQDEQAEHEPNPSSAAVSNIRAYRLPLLEEYFSDEDASVPLNIDTVLELLMRWCQTGDYSKALLFASMKHGVRHPGKDLLGAKTQQQEKDQYDDNREAARQEALRKEGFVRQAGHSKKQNEVSDKWKPRAKMYYT